MSRTRIKLCGMSRPQDVAAVNAARPDFCGFVIDCPRSRRNVSPARATELASALDPGIRTVGVFVDEPPEVVARLADSCLAAVQLHGHEDAAYIAHLRDLVDVPVWKAFKVRSAAAPPLGRGHELRHRVGRPQGPAEDARRGRGRARGVGNVTAREPQAAA